MCGQGAATRCVRVCVSHVVQCVQSSGLLASVAMC